MPYPLPLTRTEAYLAYKAGVIQQSDLKPSLAVPRNGIDAWLAYWTGLAADYPKREDGTPHILQEEEAYIAYLCGVINEYPEKCLRRVGAYLRYLISARWGRPDHPLNREELYLSLIKTQFIPSGDPSSDIVIDGTAKAPFVDVKMYGDTFQQSYTGKNLLGASLAIMQSENTGGTWSNGVYTQYGVTVTPVFSNGLLQRIELSGTATRNFIFRVAKSYSKSEFEAIVTAGETYTLSGCPSGGSPTTYYLRVTENPYKNLYTDVGDSSTRQMPTISSGATSVRLLIGIDSGTDTTGLVFRPQFEKSASATSFEPYVGGQPSPNPDYPQSIQTVTGRQVVKVEGKNLLKLAQQTATSNGITATLEDGVIFYSGEATTNWSNMSAAVVKAIPAGSYTFSMKEDFYTNFAFGLRVTYEDGTTASFEAWKYGGKKKEITFAKNVKSCYVFLSGLTTGEEYSGTLSLMLEEGSTEGTTFIPYQSGEYELNLGKNLLSMTDGTATSGTATSTVSNNNHFEVSGTVSESWGFNLVATRKQIAPIQPGTYTLSITNSLPYNMTVQFRNTSSGASLVGNLAFPSGTTSITFTLNKTANYITWWSTASVGTAVTASFDAMIEAGSTATAYAPYFTPIELCKLGSYQDYIWKDGEDWKVHKATNKVTLTGVEYWQYPNVGNSATFFQLQNNNWDESFGANTHPIGDGAGNMQPTTAFVCDCLKSIEASDSNMKINQGCGKKGVWFRIALLNTWGVSTVEQLKTWLSSHNMKVAYALATATDTIITNTNLVAQLEALVAGGAENGTTYIKVNATNPNLPGLLYVEAPKYE